MKTLAVINEIEDIRNILQKSIEFAKDDILEILFVHEEELFELPDLFRPDYLEDDNIDKDAIKKSIKTILKDLSYNKDVAIFVYINDTISRVEALLRGVSSFIVTKYNDATKGLADTQFKVLFLKEFAKIYKHIALNVELSDKDDELIGFAKRHFRDATIELIYNYIHITSADLMTIDPLIGISNDPFLDEELKDAHKDRFNTLLKKHQLNGIFLEDIENEEELIEYINKNSFDLAIIPSNNREIVSDINKDTLIVG